MGLKKIRKEKGMTQKELADASGVALRMIQAYEQGERDINKAEVSTILKLSDALDVGVRSLLDK